MAYTLTQILSLTSATTTKLVQTPYHADDTYGVTGFGFGLRPQQQILVRATRALGSSLTAVKFEVQISWSVATPNWITISAVRLGDSGGTVQQEHTLTVADNTTVEDVLATENCEGIPLVRVLAKSVTADAVAGDLAAAFVVTS